MEGHLKQIQNAIAKQAERLAYEKKKQDELTERTLYEPFMNILAERIASCARGKDRFVEFRNDANPEIGRLRDAQALLGKDLHVPTELKEILKNASLTYNPIFETDMGDEKHYRGFRVSW